MESINYFNGLFHRVSVNIDWIINYFTRNFMEEASAKRMM
jgi:hypothetical protein